METPHGWEVPPLSSSMPELRFSRFPLDLAIDVGMAAETEGLACRVVGKDQDVVIGIPHTSGADHLVIDSTWYAFARGALEDVKAILQRAGVAHAGPITLREYLELRRQLPTSPSAIVDRTPPGLMPKVAAGGAPPPGFRGNLYPYQVDGWRWLDFVSRHGIGGILADEMGLGKTIQVICLLLEEDNRNKEPSLVVTAATLLENWRRELARFAPRLSTIVHQGSARTGFPSELRAHDVVVTSYDTVVRDLAMLRVPPWNVLVLDEAQAIKNPETRRTTAIKRLPRRVAVAVTGTPLQNHLLDLWSIMDAVLPGFLGDRRRFERDYPDDSTGASAVESLVTPLLLRRRVSEVAKDLPPRIDIPQALQMDPDSARTYDRLREGLATGDQGPSLGSLVKLRMYCAHPCLIEPGGGDPLECSVKLARLLEILEEVFTSGEKAIIFASFTAMVDLVVAEVRNRFNVFCDYIDGRVPVVRRQEIIDALSTAQGAGALVLNPHAAGVGLNITAATHVIHYTLEWNPAVEDQASARAHRLGQTKPVTVHRLFYANTVEEVIDDRLARKRGLAELAVVGSVKLEDEQVDLLRALRLSPVTA